MATHGSPVGPFPPGSDEEEYDRRRRRLLWTMPSGLYLVGSFDGESRNLMTINLVSQLSLDPKLVGVVVETSAVTHELIGAGQRFALSLLKRSDRAIVRKFVKPAPDDRQAMTLNEISYFDAPVTGSPVLSSALGYIDAEVRQTVALGLHSLFIGEVVDANFLADESEEVLRMEDTKMNYGG